MGRTLINNISSIIGVSSKPLSLIKGVAMSYVETLENAYILLENDKIIEFGNMVHCPARADLIINAKNGLVLPAWCDSHTHLVWAASREDEYVMRLKGKTYQEIAKAGGGILNSALKLQQTPEDVLYHDAFLRLEQVIRFGTGAIEIKSGYGLTVEAELKMLRVIQRLKENSPATIKATFLGAHAIPLEFKDQRNKYIDIIINEMMPQIAQEKLAEYCDVFCDHGFYTVDETDRILNAAAKYGLKPKIHANELGNSGGVQVGVINNAVSVDHLEVIGEEEIEILKHSSTIPTLLPSCSFFLNIHYAPARKMIDSGLGIALATDFNPGTSPSGNIPLLMALACNHMLITPTEAFQAVTVNGAQAMEIGHSHGFISVGNKANLLITKSIPNLEYLVYDFGSNNIDQVILNGQKML